MTWSRDTLVGIIGRSICLAIALGGCGTENPAPATAALPQSDLPPGVAVRELQVRRHGRSTWAGMVADS